MKLHLIRHAATLDSLHGRAQSVDDEIIVSEDDKVYIDALKTQLGFVERVYCSALARSVATARILFGDREFLQLEDLNEYPVPLPFVGRPKSELNRYWKEHQDDVHNHLWVPEGGESYNDLVARVKRFVDQVYADKRVGHADIVVVGHGTHMKMMLLCLAATKGMNSDWETNPIILTTVLRPLVWENYHCITVEV